MNGILSAHPSPAVARLLVGQLLLFLVQAGFLLGSPEVASALRIIVMLIAGVGSGALILAIRGTPDAQTEQGRHCHDG